MTVLELAVGEVVHLRGRVVDPQSDRGICEFEIDTLDGLLRCRVAYADVVKLNSSTELVWREICEAVQEHGRLGDRLLSAQAKLYECGGHPANPLIIKP
jgi:hypothetical protein